MKDDGDDDSGEMMVVLELNARWVGTGSLVLILRVKCGRGSCELRNGKP